MVQHNIIRENFNKFWEQAPRSHKHIQPSPLFLKDDPSTLFTSSGMQQLISYLKGDAHKLGKRLYNIQPCFRSQDIDHVGDSKHITFFEMMGNWSLGDYFKEEQLEWCLEYFTKILNLPKEKLYISVFEGTDGIKKDEESYNIWKKLGFTDDKIFFYGTDHNWWSRYGDPKHMPDDEIGGPDSEVFYDFGEELRLHEKSEFKNEKCHPNCECGRFSEIGNSVFIEYIKKNNELIELPQKNVDYGGGLERISAAVNNKPDIFQTDFYQGILREIEKLTDKKYDAQNKGLMEIVADHIKASVFLINDGVLPSNKEQGYVLRRLLRRSVIKMHQLTFGFQHSYEDIVDNGILKIYDGFQNIKRSEQKDRILAVINEETNKFSKTLEKGLKEVEKVNFIDGKTAFDLFQSYGFPIEITLETLLEKNIKFDKNKLTEEFHEELNKHKEVSRKSAEKKFKK
jgi:alanyl-tRNA synthetase